MRRDRAGAQETPKRTTDAGSRRDPRQGVVLLVTLGLAISLSVIAGLVQMRSVAQTRLAAGLAAQMRADLAKDALYDRLRGLVADQMMAEAFRRDRPAFDGRPFAMEQDNRAWKVEVQDVEALANPYLSPPEILLALAPGPARILEIRAQFRQAGTRFPVLAMTLAQFGLPADLANVMTDNSTRVQLRRSTLPSELEARISPLSPHLSMDGQVQTVRVLLGPLSPE